MFTSIRRGLVLLVLLVAFPLVLATLLVVGQLANAQRESERDAMTGSARALAAALESEINRHVAVAATLAQSRTLRSGNIADFYQLSSEVVRFLPNSWLALVDPNAQQILNTLVPFGTPLPKITANAALEKVLSTNTFQISDVIIGSVSGKAVSGVFMPVFIDAKLAYVLIVIVNPDYFRRVLLQQKLPDGWLSGIIDRNGNFFARNVNHEGLVGKPASAGWRAAAKTGREGIFESRSVEGAPFESVYTNSDLTGWSVSVGASKDVLLTPFRTSLWTIALVSAALIALSIMFALWAGRRITEPMRLLEQAASGLKRGEVETVARTGMQEVDRALDAFDTAAAELREREKRQELLVNELNHRVKNTLAVIQSIASLTSRSVSSVSEFSRSFTARLIGIARTHDLLTESHWGGASLDDILRNELSPYESDTRRCVTLQGERVKLSPKVTVSLGMVFHELATNAAKYGALSQPNGRIDVSWTVTGPDATALDIDWIEKGGPAVTPPERQGFGSLLIATNVERELGGKLMLAYLPEGLRVTIAIPIDRVISGQVVSTA